MASKRRSVEFNGTELALSLLLIYPDIMCHATLVNKINDIKNNVLCDDRICLNVSSDIDGYMGDILKPEKTSIMNAFISNYHQSVLTNNFPFTTSEIQKIFIAGKTNKHPEISELNKGLSKIQAKSDIYVKLVTNAFVGISVKQSSDATKSNYSVQKMLGKEDDKILTGIRKEYLKANGFDKLDKTRRDEMNRLFYKSVENNPYWDTLKRRIQEYKVPITRQLVDALYCTGIPYDIYEYNGVNIVKLTCPEIGDQDISFEEHEPFYYDNKGQLRQTAKLFYKLDVLGTSYRVEVRWKGDIYNASPQFQIHAH